MKKPLSRRDFLHTTVLGGAGSVLVLPALAARSSAADPSNGTRSVPAAEGVCVTLCNHWSYIGIGWQLGIESCVLSATDGMEMADRPPHVKTCLNLDARAYEFMAEKFPEVAQRLKKYLAEGKLELIGGTYGQPMGTMFGGESNIRQIVVGRETIRKALDYKMVTFLEEEEFSHPQLPQILAGAGFRYASLAQVDTWGRAGIPIQEFNAIRWKGIDGTAIPTIPKNSLFGYSPDLKKLASSAAFQKLRALGKPLIFTWEEFGWESPEQPDYLRAPAKYLELAQQSDVEFVTCGEYLDKYGANPKESIYLPMDAWNKSLTWGLGGDQLRAMDRKVEGLLLAAERFDAIAAALGGHSQAERLDTAWKDLLASQSHDVGLCEYSRWQGLRMAPLDRVEDKHNFTWGAIGYNHLDSAQRQGQAALDAAVDQLRKRIDSATGQRGAHAVTVLNPCGWQRSDVAATGRIYPIAEKAAGVVVKDRKGQVVPSQIVTAERDAQGNLVVADVAFLAQGVPSLGYDTYYLDFTSHPVAAETAGVRFDPSAMTLENEYLKVRLDPSSGGILSLVGKRTGRETLDGGKAPFPALTGKPTARLSTRPQPPASYESAKSKAKIDWVEKGPLRATVRAYHESQPQWKYLRFETRVSVTAGLPYVEVTSRILAKVPPLADQQPADVKEGYWYSLAPAFTPKSIIRDFPLAVEPTKNKEFHALSFVDLVGEDLGLLVLHMGTQWFRKLDGGVLQNLVMREWESTFSQEFGWPIYSEYHHALWPHAGNLSNAERLQAATAFGQPLIARVGPPHAGDLPATKGFVTIDTPAVQLSALRTRPNGSRELRVVEVEGKNSTATVELALPIGAAYHTNLLGEKLDGRALRGNPVQIEMAPWKIETLELTAPEA